MSYQVDLTQKKNGTFLADAHPLESSADAQGPLRANPYRDAAAFRSALRNARLATESQSELEAATTEAEERPETLVSRTVDNVAPEQLRKIGLN